MFRVEDRHWWYRGLRALILAAAERHVAPGSRILDIGCGTGANLAALSPAFDVVGIDFSPDALSPCRARKLKALARADAARLPFRPCSFKAALMVDVLYHSAVDDKVGALREGGRVLSPGGVLILNVPAYEWLRSSHDEAIHTGHRFTRGEVSRLLRESGFEPVDVGYWNSLLFPAISVVRTLRRGDGSRASDLEGYREGLVTRGLSTVLSIERTARRVVPMPFGLSVFAIARKAGAQVS